MGSDLNIEICSSGKDPGSIGQGGRDVDENRDFSHYRSYAAHRMDSLRGPVILQMEVIRITNGSNSPSGRSQKS